MTQRSAKRAAGWGLRWLPGSLRRRFVILLVLLTAATMLPFHLSLQTYRELEDLPGRVEQVARLRWNLMEFSLLAHTGLGSEAGSERLTRLVERQRTTLDRLIEGDPALELAPCGEGELCRHLREHRSAWEESIVPVVEAAQSPGGLQGGLLATRIAAELDHLDTTSALASERLQQAVDRVVGQGLTAMVGSLLLLALVGYGVWEVFSRIRRVEEATRAPLEKSPLLRHAEGVDEVASLAGTLHASLSTLARQSRAEHARAVRLDAQQGALRELATRLGAWIDGRVSLEEVVTGAARGAGFDRVRLSLELPGAEEAAEHGHGCAPDLREPDGFSVPLLWGDQVVGTLCLGRSTEGELDREDRALAEAFAGTLAIAVVARSLLDERDLRARLTGFLSTLRDLEADTGALGDHLRRLVDHDLALLSLRDDSGAVEECWHLNGEEAASLRPTCGLQVGDDVAVLSPETFLACPPLFRARPEAVMVAPLLVEQRRVGLVLLARRHGRFSQREVETMRSIAPVIASTLERIRLTERLHLSEHLATVGGLSRMVAHEIRNPLNTFNLRMRLVERRLASLDVPAEERETLQEHVRILRGEMERLDRVVESYVTLATGRTAARFSTEDLRDLVAEVLDFHQARLDAHGIALEVELGEAPATASVDRTRFQQAMHNLLTNAIEAVEAAPGGRIRVALAPTEAGWAVSVRDTGPGVADPRRVFSPGFTTKSAGTGMGLPISLQIARLHGGSLLARQVPDGGAEFVLTVSQEGPADMPALSAQ